MDFSDEDIIDKIKTIEQIIVNSKAQLNVDIQIWRDRNKDIFSTLLAIDDSSKQKLKRECNKQEQLVVKQNKSKISIEDTNEYKQMRDLNEQEVTLEKEISNIENEIESAQVLNHKLQNAKTELPEKFFTKISKTFTGTSFDYQSPNVSGFVKSHGLSTFDLDPTKLSEQELSDHLWDIVAKESGEDWSDILKL